MAEEKITRKNLVVRLANIKMKDWLKVADKFDLIYTQPKGGSSHFSIRFKNPAPNDPMNGLVTTVYENVFKQANVQIFKSFINKGFEEDEIWKALKLLK